MDYLGFFIMSVDIYIYWCYLCFCILDPPLCVCKNVQTIYWSVLGVTYCQKFDSCFSQIYILK